MRGFLSLVLCAFSLLPVSTLAQSTDLEPMRAAAGTILTFYLQTRLNPTSSSALDELPKGTELRVRLLDSIDSNINHDGAPFRAVLVSPVVSADHGVIVHADAEVHGLFVLLRSRNHPEGFRYELLITHIIENGKSLDLTASLQPSFSDAQKPAPAPNGVSAEKGGSQKVEPSLSPKAPTQLPK